MASKPNKKATTGIISEIPECPVCFEPLTAPIYQCKTGHSLCNSCTRALLPPVCPLCRQDMTQTRSLLLEELVSKAQVTCPNKSAGCIYTMSNKDVEEHLKECIFKT
ncbi:Putative E3 ubiquitin-protein ligase SINA-like 9 [Eumeta japonica]|uniref:E3 ubiquitin-protein ligase SINA-like 9 n=1 Tax=Eumeta variegata TaxID=151549 RepID=A0A4C1ZEY4_EUMVA|nr:Putative E3 ubiquitin-protein ligase SINA-like 9 [Eumeta japonica]